MCNIFIPDKDRVVSVTSMHLEPIPPVVGEKVSKIIIWINLLILLSMKIYSFSESGLPPTVDLVLSFTNWTNHSTRFQIQFALEWTKSRKSLLSVPLWTKGENIAMSRNEITNPVSSLFRYLFRDSLCAIWWVVDSWDIFAATLNILLLGFVACHKNQTLR